MHEGVLVGCDQEQEWLLSWWWENYARHNQHPVVFADFGMSENAKKWCQERGKLLEMAGTDFSVAQRKDYPEERADLWERRCEKIVWHARTAWFKKPYAMLQTPFERTVWLDLDCEVMGSIAPLFAYCDATSGVGIMPEFPSTEHWWREEGGELLSGEVLYNSGVMAFQKNAPLIRMWAEATLEGQREFTGDQDLLSRLIHTHQLQIHEIPRIYNWRISQGFHHEIVILHWLGQAGKEYIRKKGGLSQEFAEFRKFLNLDKSPL